MKLFSKQISNVTAATTGKLHSAPVSPSISVSKTSEVSKAISSPAVLGKTVISALKAPTLLKNIDIISRARSESYNLEATSSSSAKSKIFEINTGLVEDEPTIVLSSEFLPLYEQSIKTSQGRDVGLKYEAKLVNAKTAMTLLLEEEDVLDVIESNKSDLKNFIQTQNTFATNLMNVVSDVVTSMDVSYQGMWVLGDFGIILKDAGYYSNDISKYSQTKLWQQALMELKKALLTHTPGLLGSKPTRTANPADSDPYQLSDVDGKPQGAKRIWLNPYVDLPEPKALADASKIDANITRFLSFHKKQYVDLNSPNPPERKENTASVTDKDAVVLKTGKLLGGLSPVVLSNSVLKPYEASGRDISIVANAVFKEAVYSAAINNSTYTPILSSKYGYTPTTTGDNFRVWDHVVGRFTRSVLEIPTSPAGNGNSLVSFSNAIATTGQDTNHVLTFENQYVQDTNVTPGVYYYIESSLNTVDGKSFDLTRLNTLIDKTKSAYDTLKLISNFIGYEINTSTGTFTKRELPPELTLDGLCDHLSATTQYYKPALVTKVVKNLGLEGIEIEGLDPNYLKRLSGGFGPTGVRLASMICKLTIDPPSAYYKSYEKIKALLFMWLMSNVLEQTEGMSNSIVSGQLKKHISYYLSEKPIRYDGDIISKAVDEGRTFPTALGDSPGVSVPSEKPEEESYSPSEESPDDVAYEKKKTYTVYALSTAGRVFQIEANMGIWKAIIDAMKTVYRNSDIYVKNNTGYSGASKTAFLYSYFDLIMRIIAAQTPERLVGPYTSTYEFTSLPGSGNKPIMIEETGLLVDDITKEQLAPYYDTYRFQFFDTASRVVPLLSDAVGFSRSESDSLLFMLEKYKNFIAKMNASLNSYGIFLEKNFESHLSTVNSLYSSDSSLTESQKRALLNMSFFEEQMILTKYIMSEYSDRISESTDLASKLKSTPTFAEFPEKFIDLMNTNDVEFVSYKMLGPYFRDKEFSSKLGNNKKIVSVGIPHKLVRTLRSSVRLSTASAKRTKENVVRLKVYKLDRLHPDVVYIPQTFTFEMNRYPTRVIGNWDFDSYIKEDIDILNIPSKIYTPKNNFVLAKNITEGFPQEFYGRDSESFLSEVERNEIYRNHAVSFLAEEYLRWFTDCNFDETRYHNFGQLTNTLTNIDAQYARYVDSISRKFTPVSRPAGSPPPSSTSTSPTGKTVLAQVNDYSTASSYNVATKAPLSNTTKSQQGNSTSQKSFTIPFDDTIKVFFENETLLLDPDVYKRRAVYPKKFDRVFHMIIDPDDFYIDESMTRSETLAAMKDLGIIEGGIANGVKTPYRHRATTPDDATLDEYFVTVEPYEYTEELEV